MNYQFERLTPIPVSTPEAYAQSFKRKEPVIATSLCGRILRGKTAQDFTTLTDDATRKVVMLMGPDGLSILPDKNSSDMLEAIGYTRQYIAQKVSDGTQFKLAVFPESRDAKPATWNNIIDLVSKAYPGIASTLARHHRQLANTKFQDIQNQAGFSFAEVDAIGPSDPRYMSLERFMESPKSATDLRAFLYFSVYLKELYSGDGYTYTPDGQRGMQEYATLNRPLNSFGKSVLLDIIF